MYKYCVMWIRLVVLMNSVINDTEGQLYDGHKLVRIYPSSNEQLDHVHELAKRSNRQVRFWEDDVKEFRSSDYLPSAVDIMTSRDAFDSLMTSLGKHQLPYDIISDNIQSGLDSHMSDNSKARTRGDVYFHSYHPLDEMFTFMDTLASRCGGRCTIFTAGTSFEGRPLRGLKITGQPQGHKKRKLWIDAGIHAREWISHATAQFIMERLVDEYQSDDFVREMVDSYEWYILPCVNPDGYNFTWETDRLWRKTRRPNPDTACVGTDANRNFGFRWGEVGVSSDPCANNYQGPAPFSEPEARAVADFVQARNGSWDMYLTLHSRGQLIMAPWGYTLEQPEDYTDLERVGKAMKGAIYFAHGQNYTFGSASAVLYLSSGTSRDWARGVPGIKYVYTIELRDRGQFGWVLPPDQIVPTGQEIWTGLRAAVNAIMS